MPTRQRIAVVGGTGFLGSHLSEHLLGQGHDVLVAARSLRRSANLPEHPKLRFEAADITDRPSIVSALRTFRPDVVYHLACGSDAPESPEHMQLCLENNAMGTLNTLQAAIASSAGLFVFADSSKVYGNGPVPFRAGQPERPICSYAIAKAAGWRLCTLLADRAHVKVVGLRPTFIYGPRQNFNLLSYVEQAVHKDGPIRIQGGGQTRDLLYIEDAVRCFECVIHSAATWGRSIPIGGGREIPVRELCREILHALDSSATLVEDQHAVRPTEIWRSFCDNAEIRQLCGWWPRVGLREGLRKTFTPRICRAEIRPRMEAVAG